MPALARHPLCADAADDRFQAQLLQGVSRSFALTIPLLPREVYPVVANAYLLCRIADTFEDEPALTPAQKRYFSDRFVAAVAGQGSPEQFAAALTPLLSERTSAPVHELIRCTPRVIAITRGFSARQQQALLHTVRLMARGMAEFQERKNLCGLDDLDALTRYGYYVAGVVGEMLTTLFCDYSMEMARHRDPLLAMAVSFGQGLQMTNILKDIWDDRRRGICWLPRDVFAEVGVDLSTLAPGRQRERFALGLARLLGITHAHLRDALAYTLLVPRTETGIREFCLWAIGMAMLTLRNINRHRHFCSGDEVKISRRSVRAIAIVCRLTAAHDPLIASLFSWLGRELPGPGDTGVHTASLRRLSPEHVR
jgi:farnesyl-diphosphate farnesyltransferase